MFIVHCSCSLFIVPTVLLSSLMMFFLVCWVLTIYLVCWLCIWYVDLISGMLTLYLVCWPHIWYVDYVSGMLTLFLVCWYVLFKLSRSGNKNWTHKNKSDWGQDLRVSWYIMELLSTSIYNSFARVSITLYIPPWERYKTFLSYHISSYLASSKIPDHTCWPGWSKVLPWICLQIQCHCWWLHTQAAQHMFLRNGWVVQTNQPE